MTFVGCIGAQSKLSQTKASLYGYEHIGGKEKEGNLNKAFSV